MWTALFCIAFIILIIVGLYKLFNRFSWLGYVVAGLVLTGSALITYFGKGTL